MLYEPRGINGASVKGNVWLLNEVDYGRRSKPLLSGRERDYIDIRNPGARWCSV